MCNCRFIQVVWARRDPGDPDGIDPAVVSEEVSKPPAVGSPTAQPMSPHGARPPRPYMGRGARPTPHDGAVPGPTADPALQAKLAALAKEQQDTREKLAAALAKQKDLLARVAKATAMTPEAKLDAVKKIKAMITSIQQQQTDLLESGTCPPFASLVSSLLEA